MGEKVAREEFEVLQAGLRQLQDRAEIRDCLMRYCRGVDRLDWELAESAYFPDGIDNRGAITAHPKDYLAWSRKNIEPASWTSHNISNITYDIAGNTAHTEAYVMTFVGSPDGEKVTIGGARYISRFERRNGEWRLIRQETAMDYRFTTAVEHLPPGALRGRRDKSDRSYDRPLDLSAEARARFESRET